MNKYTWQRRLVAAVTSAIMAGFGCTSVASAQTITGTGPYSTIRIDTNIQNECTVKNTNDISVGNTNYQTGRTGNASVSGNTSVGASWSGWESLNPNRAMENHVSHDAWWNSVVDWMGQHGSGNGWSSAGSDLSWAPEHTDWTGYNPMTWQANGQTFGNWWNATQHYLDDNSTLWLLGWPADATSSGNYGEDATSGSVVTSNNASFTIAVNNAASAAAGVNACGQSNFTPPVVTSPTGGKGGGPIVTPATPASVTPGTSITPSSQTGAGSRPGGSAGAEVAAGVSHVPSTTVPSSSNPGTSTPPVVTSPASVPPQETTVGPTGPGSANTVSTVVHNETSVTNTNYISISNTNYQTGTSGDASVSGNTYGASTTSGDVTNANYTSVYVNVSN